MTSKNYFTIPEIRNLYQFDKECDKAEIFQTLHEAFGSNVEIKRIVSFRTPSEEWYEQLEDEWVAVLKGKAKLEMDLNRYTSLDSTNELQENTENSHSISEKNTITIEMQSGDYILIPSRMRHLVAFIEPTTVWLAIHISRSIN